MILKRYYDEKLAQASYLVGCAATGEALVVDANRDVEQYVRGAEAEGLRITHVTETHIHADYVSGSRELVERTGAKLYVSDEGGPDWTYGFAREYDAVLLKDGDAFGVGNIRIEAVHTPGHTPEHLSFVVTDGAAADRPMGVFTGDFLFVGDVGRPDLLERAARHTGTMEAGARQLFGSLRSFAQRLPDYVQIWPGHGAGSACGKSLGGVPQSTLGYEKLFNWAFGIDDEAQFVEAVLAGQPEPPMYFAEMKRINREGPAILRGLPRPERLAAARLADVLRGDAIVVDTRHPTEFGAGHLPGSINIPLTRSFTTSAGSVLPYDRDLYLVLTGGDEGVESIVRDLQSIGLDRVVGYFGERAALDWLAEVGAAETVAEMPADQVEEQLGAGAVEVIDVRNGPEWAAGHIPGSLNLPLSRLRETVDRVPRDKPLVVHCLSGIRASAAIATLQASGFPDVRHLAGDFVGWKAEGRPVVAGTEVPSAA